MASQNNLSDLIQLKNIYIGENFEEKTHIFSSNVFIPQNIKEISLKIIFYVFVKKF